MKYPFALFFCFFLAHCTEQNSYPNIPIANVPPNDSTDIAPTGVFSISSMISVDSTFFLSSGQSKTVVKTNQRFEVLNRYSAIGRGPFELGDASELTNSEERVYMIDFSQRKLIEFTHELIPVDEFFVEKPPFSIISVDDQLLWLGALDLTREDIYEIDFEAKEISPLGELVKTRYPMEGLVSHTKNLSGNLLRYRQYHHRLDLFRADGTHITFTNPTRPERPEVDASIPGYPVFISKIHNSAFLTADRACVLSGDHTPGNQPVQCFDFDGNLVARYSLKQDPSMISVYADSTLYTYSPKTNHIYVYTLGF